MIRRVALLIAVVMAGVVGASAPALADNPRSRASCEYWPSTGTGPPYAGGWSSSSDPDYYAYSPQFTTKTWSGCNDIQSPYRERFGPYPTTYNTWFRVRFYPSSGGSYANSWKSNNIDPSANLIIATAVANNTRFRVETQRRLAGGPIIQEPHNFDLMF